jgi:cell division protein FtsL
MFSISTAAERFIHTNFLARQKFGRSPNDSRRLSFFMISMGLVIMACFFVFLWVRIYNLEIGYQISSAHKTHERLLQENRQLRIERASLHAPSRIEGIAKNKLGMITPSDSQIFILRLPRSAKVGESK